MQRDKSRVAVIGLGNMGKNHVRTYSVLPSAHLQAVCDREAGLAMSLSTQYGGRVYTDIDAMLANESLDAVSISTSTSSHFEVAKKVLSKGISALIEKPITDTLESAQELIALARANDCTLMVGHIERFNPAVQALKLAISSGRLGDIVSVLTRRVSPPPPQIQDADVLIDLAVHDIDVIAYLLGVQPTLASVSSGRAVISDRDDYATLLLKYGAASAVVDVNWITPVRERTLTMTGTKAYAKMDYIAKTLVLHESGQLVDVPVKLIESLYAELDHFLLCVRSKKIPMVSGQDGLNALQVALDARVKIV